MLMKTVKQCLLAACGFWLCSIALASTGHTLSMQETSTAIAVNQALKVNQTYTSINSATHADSELVSQRLEYKTSLALRQTNLQEFAAKRQVAHLEGAKDLEQMLSSDKVIDAIQQTIEPYGLSINNLADAYALWWITAWQASEGNLAKVDKETAQAVKKQATIIWLANPKLVDATDANKQEIAEALLIQALLIQAAIDRAGSDKDSQEAVIQAVREGAASSGLALETMQLTNNGFVKR
jgi:hypothetical protein